MKLEKRFNRHLIICISILSGIGFSNGALAAPTLCSSYVSPNTHPDGLSVNDVTFGLLSSSDCYGVVEDNDTTTNIWSTTGWTFLAKDNTPGGIDPLSGTVLGVTFTLNAEPEGGAASGTWNLSWLQTGTPGYDVKMDVIAVIKASDRFASYLFEDLSFTTNNSIGTDGTWKVAYKKPAGRNLITPDLSHLSLYYRDATHSDPCTSNCGGGGSSVPEPTQLALLGIGFMGMALARRNSRQA